MASKNPLGLLATRMINRLGQAEDPKLNQQTILNAINTAVNSRNPTSFLEFFYSSSGGAGGRICVPTNEWASKCSIVIRLSLGKCS